MLIETRRKSATLVLSGLLAGLVLAVAGTAAAGYFEPEHFSRIVAYFDGTSAAVKVSTTTPLPVTGTMTATGTVTANQGTSGASAWPVVQAQPASAPTVSGLLVANQAVGPENADIAANPNRASLLIRLAGTGVCLISPGVATGGGAVGVPLQGGTADDDGTGEYWSTDATYAVWVWDVGGTGTCKFRYVEEVW